MPASNKLTILGALLAATVIIGFIYIANLRSELGDARQEMSSLQQQVQTLNETVTKIEAGRTSIANERERLQAQLSEATAKLMGLSEGNAKQIEDLNRQLSELRTTTAYRNKVAGWWRDLFDYSKTFNNPNGTVARSSDATAAVASN